MSTIGRPRLSDAEREKRRLDKNQRQRDRRAEIKLARDDAKQTMARAGVQKREVKNPTPGWPSFEPTSEDRVRVETLSGLGMRHDEIALMIVNPLTAAPVNEKTLRGHFSNELAQGVVKANSKVAESLYQQATGTGGATLSTTAGIFWAKVRMGWRETQHVELEVKSGVLVAPAGISPADWIAQAMKRNEGKIEPGTEIEA